MRRSRDMLIRDIRSSCSGQEFVSPSHDACCAPWAPALTMIFNADIVEPTCAFVLQVATWADNA
eukprot:3437449-Pleurochrysis_carterae.AAC.1